MAALTGRGALDVIEFTGGPVSLDLDVRWIHGQPSRSQVSDPPLQVHWAEPHTAIIRQSKQQTYEAPFLYLLFGSDRALLLDTGDVEDVAAMPLRPTVDRLVGEWLRQHRPDLVDGVAGYPLVVAHTHAHRDHVRGDGQFVGRPATTVVGLQVDEVRRFFGFTSWPRERVQFDLGGRMLTITGIPGHHEASIAVYDPWTGALLTGDTIYPGRLYVNDIEAFVESLDALVSLARELPVTAVLGCHIEMTRTPRLDYPLGSRFQPDEAPLVMTVAQLRRVRECSHIVKDRPGVHVFDDFELFNGRCLTGIARQLLRANIDRVRALTGGQPAVHDSTSGRTATPSEQA